MEVPADRLSPATLDSLITEFVTREGTEYGENDVSLEDKIASVREQLRRRDIVIVFDAESESCNIVTLAQLRDIERTKV